MSGTQPGLRQRLEEDMKSAMRAKDKERLGTVRLMLAAIKQREIDERITLDDAQIIAVLDKMTKQRRDSITQYEAAGRQELADIEAAEIRVIQAYLPAALGEAELDRPDPRRHRRQRRRRPARRRQSHGRAQTATPRPRRHGPRQPQSQRRPGFRINHSGPADVPLGIGIQSSPWPAASSAVH